MPRRVALTWPWRHQAHLRAWNSLMLRLHGKWGLRRVLGGSCATGIVWNSAGGTCLPPAPPPPRYLFLQPFVLISIDVYTFTVGSRLQPPAAILFVLLLQLFLASLSVGSIPPLRKDSFFKEKIQWNLTTLTFDLITECRTLPPSHTKQGFSVCMCMFKT